LNRVSVGTFVTTFRVFLSSRISARMIVMRRRQRFGRSYLAHKIKLPWQAVDVPRRLDEKPSL